MKIDLGGKRAIVTGGSRGIGRAMALAFAAAGARVSICARGSEALAKTRSDIAQSGHEAHAAVCDVADAAALAAYIEDAAAALGGIDILVNNASGFGTTDDEAGWEKSISVDLLATARATRAALPYLEKSAAGTILNISSISGFRATPAPRPMLRSRRRSSNIPRRPPRNSPARASASTASPPARSNFPAAPGIGRRARTPLSTPRSCAASRSAASAGPKRWRRSRCFYARRSPIGSPARTSRSTAARCYSPQPQISKKTVSPPPCRTMSKRYPGVPPVASSRAAIRVRRRTGSSTDISTGSDSLSASPAK